MARVVTTTCPGCGPVRPSIDVCKVLVTSDIATRGGRYTFVCPRCAILITKPASDDAVEVLVRGGVRIVVIPLEHLERCWPPQRRPLITEDELASFAGELELTDDLSIVAEWEGMSWR